jgi:hypothetical protein
VTEDITESVIAPLSKVELALSWKRRRRRKGSEAFEVFPGVTCVKLTQGRYTLIDSEDWQRISHLKWHAHRSDWGSYYAISAIQLPEGPATIQMSRVVMNCPDDLVVDHKNGHTLINRKFNLRCVTMRVNARNRHSKKTSVYPGVCWNTYAEKWRVGVQFEGQNLHLGFFDDEDEAGEVSRRASEQIDAGTFVRPHSRKDTGRPNVSWNKWHEKWQARVTINGKRVQLGDFDSVEDALAAVERSRQTKEPTP